MSETILNVLTVIGALCVVSVIAGLVLALLYDEDEDQ